MLNFLDVHDILFTDIFEWLSSLYMFFESLRVLCKLYGKSLSDLFLT